MQVILCSLLTSIRDTKQHLNWTAQHISPSSFARALPHILAMTISHLSISYTSANSTLLHLLFLICCLRPFLIQAFKQPLITTQPASIGFYMPKKLNKLLQFLLKIHANLLVLLTILFPLAANHLLIRFSYSEFVRFCLTRINKGACSFLRTRLLQSILAVPSMPTQAGTCLFCLLVIGHVTFHRVWPQCQD